jgi:hypothetical protein
MDIALKKLQIEAKNNNKLENNIIKEYQMKMKQALEIFKL